MHRLALKLPTILQHTATNPILFHEAGVSEFRHLDNHPDFNALYFPTGEHLSRIWALIDTNPKLPDPAGIFKQGTPFFVIDAISPRSEHVGWLDKTGYKEFYMNPWSIWEVFQAYVDPTSAGSRHTPFVVARSSVERPAQNISSGICTTSLAHPPGPWLHMPTIRKATKHTSTKNSTR